MNAATHRAPRTRDVTDTGDQIDDHPGDTARASLRQRKKDATHQAIGDAAWELFAERGYDETSINDIAERANVAPRTFFRYYPTKEAVLYPEFADLLIQMRKAFNARPADEPVLHSLLAAIETMSNMMTAANDRNQARLSMMKTAHNESMGEYFRSKMVAEVAELVRQRDAHRPDCDLRAQLASGILSVILDTARAHWLETGASESFPDVGNRCMTLVHELLD